MKHPAAAVAIACAVFLTATSAAAQSADADRAATRERLRALLTSYGPTVKITNFKQSEKNEWNFTGSLKEGLKNADFFELVVGITPNKTIMVSSYPHYKGAYVNVDKARNPLGLLRRMAHMGFTNFIPWATDDTGDVLARYPVALESGFPTEVIQTVLRSVANLDEYLGQMRPDIDGSNP